MDSKPRILLVEDDKYFNKLLFDRLSLEGFEVESCLEGETAWSKLEEARLQSQPFQILVSDMLVPRLMGAELFSRVRDSNEYENLILIAISGIYKDPVQIQEISTLHGLKAYWTKPFDLGAFVRALKDPKLGEEAQSADFKPPPSGGSLTNGRLETRRMERLFLDAYSQGFSGKLKFKRDDSHRTLYFANGFPVSAESSLLNESLGQSFVELKIIDKATQEKASELMVVEGLKFGQMLLKMNALSKDGLFQGIRKHTYRLLMNTFLWKEGDYEWQSLESLPDYILPLEFNPMLLLLKAHKGLYSIDFLKQLFEVKFESFPVVSPRAVQILPLFNLDSQSLEFLSRVPSDKPFAETLKKIPEKAHESFFRVFFLLETLELLTWSSEAQIPSDAPIQRASFEEKFLQAEAQKQSKSQILIQLQAEYMELLGQNYFQVFDLPEEKDIKLDQIESTYRELRVRYHPDRFEVQGISGEVQRIIDDMLARIDRAYQTLSNPEQRAEYLRTLKSQRDDSAAESKRFLDAQDKFREGERMLANQDFQRAAESFYAAQKFWNKGVEYGLYALYADIRAAQKKQASPAELERSVQKLKAAVGEHKMSDLGYVLLGRAYAALQLRDQAKEAFQYALKINDQNEEASIALAKWGQEDFKKDHLSRVLRQSKSRIKQMLLYASLVLVALVAFVTKDLWLLPKDPNVSSFEVEPLKGILPVVEAHGKAPVAKVVIEEGRLAAMPDAVLTTKCIQVLQALKSHGILELYLLDQKEGLKARCRGEKLKRYGK